MTPTAERAKKLFTYHLGRQQVIGIHWIDGKRIRTILTSFAEAGLTVPMVEKWRALPLQMRKAHCPHAKKNCRCRQELAAQWGVKDAELRDADRVARVDAQRISRHFTEWLTSVENTKARGTYENARLTRDQYLEIVKDHALWVREPETPTRREYDIQNAEKFLAGLKASGLSVNSQRLRLRTLRVFLHWLVRRKKLEAIPTTEDWKEMAPRPQKRKHRVLTDEQVQQVFSILYDRAANAHNDERKRLSLLHLRFVMLAVGTGRRLGEIWSRRWDDFSEDFTRLRITHRPEIGFTTKNGEESEARVPATVAAWMLQQRDEYPDEEWIFDATDADGNHVQAFGRYSLTRTMRRLLDKIKADPAVKPTHGWRSRLISTLFEQGDDLETVRLTIGHKSQATTALYLSKPDAKVDSAVEQYDSGLSELINKPRLRVVDGGQ